MRGGRRARARDGATERERMVIMVLILGYIKFGNDGVVDEV